MGDVTRILSDIEGGDSGAAEQLLPLIYDELRRLAAQKMAGESPEHTLQATALVHEAYVRMVDVDLAQNWDSRGHFFAAAAEAMRRILVETARSKSRLKRGGGLRRVDLENISPLDERPVDEVLEIDQALAKLGSEDSQAAELIKLRYFSGFSIEQSAKILGIPRSTAYDQWEYAKAWLRCELSRR